MSQYFPEKLDKSLDRYQNKVMTETRFYEPMLDYLDNQEERFQTEDLVDYANSENPGSRIDNHRVGSFLGALRDKYVLIDGSLEDGSYHWDPELQAEGSWKEVKKELDEINQAKKSKV